jgi:acyl-CoA thioester hydrolase
MDQNGHMRTTAYLAAAENSRMRYFATFGFSVEEFARRGLGPVIQSDELRYKAELRLLDTATIELAMVGLSADGARFRMRNTFIRSDGRVAGFVTSTGGWLDLAARKLTRPAVDLLDLLNSLIRSEDFEALSSPLERR